MAEEKITMASREAREKGIRWQIDRGSADSGDVKVFPLAKAEEKLNNWMGAWREHVPFYANSIYKGMEEVMEHLDSNPYGTMERVYMLDDDKANNQIKAIEYVLQKYRNEGYIVSMSQPKNSLSDDRKYVTVLIGMQVTERTQVIDVPEFLKANQEATKREIPKDEKGGEA